MLKRAYPCLTTKSRLNPASFIAKEKPSIGLILCKDRKGLIAEYALKDISKPMGVSEYQLVAAMPEDLPTVESIKKLEDKPKKRLTQKKTKD